MQGSRKRTSVARFRICKLKQNQ